MPFKPIVLGAFAAVVGAVNWDINVSNNANELAFFPDTTTANANDTITFHFYPKKHNVVQGVFEAPCQPEAGGFYSGFVPSVEGEANTTFVITLDNVDPIYFYCSATDHCRKGMVGIINPPTSGSDTLDAYKNNSAIVTNDNIITPNVTAGTGGIFVGAFNSTMGNSSVFGNVSASATSSISLASVSVTVTTGTTSATDVSTTRPNISTKPTNGAVGLGSSVVGFVALIAGAVVFG